jgi:para-aminobenzoate synthetase component 1
MQPVVKELVPAPDVWGALRALADRPGVVLFESALQRESLGRYSFLTADPYERFVLDRAEYGRDPFGDLRARLGERRRDPIVGLPPFQGGAAGLASYELGACWERLPQAKFDEFRLPCLLAGLYDWVLAWDHLQQRAWIIAQGLNGDPARRVREVESALAANDSGTTSAPDAASVRGASARVQPLTPPHPVPGAGHVVSNFSREQYLDAVGRVIEYIRAGDIFQANLSQRLLSRATCAPLELYGRLRRHNPAPFAGYFAHDDWAVISSSPERFLRVDGHGVETRPIKGTRQRRSIPEADLFTRDELRESEKDQAENVMIVDLLRNDLSRVCRPESIRVPKLCTVETYETVQHLVSEVRGELREGRDFWDLLAAAFPGGSITGAPKVRAMEIITERERIARGAYCGSLFYCGFDGRADSNILIRTCVQRGGWVQCSVGGGIVAQSDPAAEYDETLHKAAGMLRALRDST